MQRTTTPDPDTRHEAAAPASRARAAAVLLAALLAAAACREVPPAPDVAARIGEREVPFAAFESWVEREVGEDPAALPSDVLSPLFDRFLGEMLLARLAADEGLAPEGVAPRAAADKLLERAVREGSAVPGEEEMRTFYSEHREEFSRGERVRLRQILVEDRETGEEALAALDAGATFEEVAGRLSDDPSADFGGDQGELTREELPPPFAATIFALEPGEVSELVAADYGYHIFQVTERLPSQVVPFDEARPEIRRRLSERRLDDLLASLVEEARHRYNVVIFERHLPFDYRGVYGEAA